ncbi:unnamed protein product [Paramecium pentaurelia]|uniref:Uncharacterized protein n=1 Tax=Paramecium pentaurelia TaxID=43138 RepID=A0A8S1VYB9_9CILI|nr:unnamed protein product [Paramecium pentaurelia]
MIEISNFFILLPEEEEDLWKHPKKPNSVSIFLQCTDANKIEIGKAPLTPKVRAPQTLKEKILAFQLLIQVKNKNK